MAEGLRTHMTYWQSPLLFCGLFDFFALWLASDVPSTEFHVNYDLMTFGDTLRDGSCFCKLVSLMEHLPLKFMFNISVSLLQVMF